MIRKKKKRHLEQIAYHVPHDEKLLCSRREPLKDEFAKKKKTYLASAVIVELTERSHRCVFALYNALVQRIVCRG